MSQRSSLMAAASINCLATRRSSTPARCFLIGAARLHVVERIEVASAATASSSIAACQRRLRLPGAHAAWRRRRNKPSRSRRAPCRRRARWRPGRPSRSRRGGAQIRQRPRGVFLPAPARGSRSASSCAPSAVSNSPLKKSSALTRRLPFGPWRSRPRRRAPAGRPAIRPPDRRRRSSRRACRGCGSRHGRYAAAPARSAAHGGRYRRSARPGRGGSARRSRPSPFLTAMPVEPADAVDVDQQRWRRQPHVERGDQALPAGRAAAPRSCAPSSARPHARPISPWHRQMAQASPVFLPAALVFSYCGGE